MLVNSANWRLGGRFELEPVDGDERGGEEVQDEGEAQIQELDAESGSEEEEKSEEDVNVGESGGQSYDPLRASQVSRRTEGLLSTARGLMSAGREAMTESKKQQLGFHLGDLREIRSNLVVLINRYQDQEETLLHLVTLLGHVEEALQHLDLDPEPSSPASQPTTASSASSAPSASSASSSALPQNLGNVVDMRSSMRVSQMYHEEDDEASDEEGEEEDAPAAMACSNAAGCSTDASYGDCGMCWEGMTEGNSRELECHHRFCDECLAHYLRAELEEARVIDINCPQQGCSELLCEEDVEELLTEAEFRRLQQLIFLTEVRQDPNARWCPQPGCESVCRINPSLPAVQPLQCATCQLVFCAACSLPHEPRISCRRAAKQAIRREKKTLGKQHAKHRKESLKAIQDSGCKKCPGCGASVSKVSGCNHMTCQYDLSFLLLFLHFTFWYR